MNKHAIIKKILKFSYRNTTDLSYTDSIYTVHGTKSWQKFVKSQDS